MWEKPIPVDNLKKFRIKHNPNLGLQTNNAD